MNNAYGEFSQYYDLLGWNRFAKVCAVRLKSFFRLRGDTPDTVLNLACGTGELEKLLSKTKIKFTGVDASPCMLKIARKKCPQYKFVLGDVASVRLKKKFDMVFFLFDAANHLNSLSHLMRTFKNAKRHLNEGGYFVFDINTPAGLKEWEEASIRKTKNFTCLVTGKYNDEKLTAVANIEAFIKEGNKYRRVNQKVVEKTWPAVDILNGLVEAGLENITVTSFNIEEEIEDAKRLWFICG